jgi:hypothetical protein
MARFRVLIAGGGVAALEAALALRHLGEDRVSTALIAPEPKFWYRPLAVVEPFGVGHVHGIDLAQLADECGALFVVDSLASVDADAHLVRTAEAAELEYDAFSSPRCAAGACDPGRDHVSRPGRCRGLLEAAVLAPGRCAGPRRLRRTGRRRLAAPAL